MILLKTFNDKKEPLFEITFYYDITRGEFNTFFNGEILEYEVKLKKTGINLVKVEMGHMDTEEYEMNVPDIDLELNYGTKFLKVHDVIVKRLNNPNDKGIILFHGVPGSGKTTYIKYLTRLITDKEILFIPPSMAESLSEPSIIPFLMEHKNSVLIVEDAERVIADREGNGSSMGVSNILNLTDGILGDCLNIQIIATFNMKKEKIDQALLRKGRLIAEHKFDKLSIDDTVRLLKHIGKEGTVTEPMTLADIYNIDEELFKVDDKLKIGFK
jgi:SpoVK/Ycf46/Vps4 family AAA+-type ATPase